MDKGPLVQDLMPIGRFAQASRLSPKALRLYDELGLLPPSYVDEHSGYRYYVEAQLEPAKLINRLRQLGMPLERIACVLTLSSRERVQAIKAYWREVETDVSSRRRLLNYLVPYLEGKGNTMYNVDTRDVPEQKVATLQGNVLAKDLPRFIGDAMSAIHDHLTEANCKAGGAGFVVYHGEVNEDSDGPVEVCLPFTGTLEPAGDMRVRLEPAHQEAFTRLTKAQVAFPEILGAFGTVGEWIKSQGKEELSPPREVYFAPWDAVGPDDPACDVAWPFR